MPVACARSSHWCRATVVRIVSLEVSKAGERRRLEFDVRLPRDIPPSRIVARIADLEDVIEVRWTD